MGGKPDWHWPKGDGAASSGDVRRTLARTVPLEGAKGQVGASHPSSSVVSQAGVTGERSCR